jgi:hypothetical protein
MLYLFTTYYISSNKERQAELEYCLKKNLENRYITKIYLLNNEIFNLDFINDTEKKIVQVIINDSPNYKLKFSDAIHYINLNFYNEICILSNTDIYFDETIARINYENIKNKMFALLRYDLDEDYKTTKIFTEWGIPREDSQDSWAFVSPLEINYNDINFEFGTLGCDSVFAAKVHDTGIKVLNPSLDIVSVHVHGSNFRTYNVDNRIHGTYLMIEPCKLGEDSKIKTMEY